MSSSVWILPAEHSVNGRKLNASGAYKETQ